MARQRTLLVVASGVEAIAQAQTVRSNVLQLQARQHRGDERTVIREEHLVEHEGGDCPVDQEVEPFDDAAAEAAEDESKASGFRR